MPNRITGLATGIDIDAEIDKDILSEESLGIFVDRKK